MQNYITVWISSQVRRACATVQAFAVLAALPLGAAELTHRWSFNGDYSVTLCCTYGTNLNNDRAGMKNPGEIAVDGTMASYEIGVDYHIAGTDR